MFGLGEPNLFGSRLAFFSCFRIGGSVWVFGEGFGAFLFRLQAAPPTRSLILSPKLKHPKP